MRLKWYFCNKPTPNVREKPPFKPFTGYPNLEAFLNELEEEISEIVDSKLGYSTFPKQE